MIHRQDAKNAKKESKQFLAILASWR